MRPFSTRLLRADRDPAVPAIRIVLASLLLFLLTGAAQADVLVRKYDWITADQVSGSLNLAVAEDGSRVVDFEFNDRGRGPKLHEVLRVDEAGLLTSVEISGHAYMGAPVDERFAVKDGTARWTSTLEQGTAPAGAFYWSNDGTAEEVAILARALLGNEAGRLPLYPAGFAVIKRVAEYKLADAGGVTASLYAISGLDLEPVYVWLDPNKELFALTLGWMGLIKQGQAAVLPELQKLQDQVDSAWNRELADELSETMPQAWLLRNVTVVDVEAGVLQPNRAVEVHAGRITQVLNDSDVAALVESQPGLVIVDGAGHYLVPGLWDMHTHLSLGDGLLHIAAGVTTVRDLGNEPARLAEIRAAFDANEVIGPRTYVAGFIDRKSPFSAPTGRLVDTLEEALAAVREYSEMGYPQIKIYSSIDPDWVAPIAAEVHKHGMRLSGHIPSYMTAEQAVNDGFDEIQHVNMLFLNFLAGPEDDTRTPLRFTLVAEKAGDLDLASPQVTDFIALLQKRGIVIDPTVAVFDSMFRHRAGEVEPAYAVVAAHMPPSVQRSMLAGEMDITEANAARYERSAQALLNMILLLHQAGVPLVSGTDGMAGFTLQRELELYQQAGISAPDVLRIATIGAARVVGAEHSSGSIAPGKQADFVLLAHNPLQDINAVRTPIAVFKGDRRFDPAKLYQAVGIRPFVD